MELRCPYCNTVLTTKVYWNTIRRIREEEKQKAKIIQFKLETQLKKHYEEHYSKKLKEIETARKNLKDAEKQFELEKRRIKKSLRVELEQEFKRSYYEKENYLKKKLQEVADIKSNLKKQKAEIRSSTKRELELEYDNRLQKEKQKLEKRHRELDEKEFQFKIEKQDIVASYEKRQRHLERLNEELKQEIERKTLQELGDIPEEKLKDILNREFPEDLFDRAGKGRAGGDVIETIMLNNRLIGKILYESKNEKNWKNAWITKIKEDRALIGTPYAILVSKAFPRNTKHFTIVQGIPIVSPRLLPHLARIIRSSIIAIERQKLSAFEKEEKVGLLYSYLNSSEFKSCAMSIAESIENLNKIRTDERTTHEKTWTKEEHEVNSISKNFAKIHSNIETIIEKESIQLEIKDNRKKEKVASKIPTD